MGSLAQRHSIIRNMTKSNSPNGTVMAKRGVTIRSPSWFNPIKTRTPETRLTSSRQQNRHGPAFHRTPYSCERWSGTNTAMPIQVMNDIGAIPIKSPAPAKGIMSCAPDSSPQSHTRCITYRTESPCQNPRLRSRILSERMNVAIEIQPRRRRRYRSLRERMIMAVRECPADEIADCEHGG